MWRMAPSISTAAGVLTAALVLLTLTHFVTSIEVDRAYFRYLLTFDITQSMNVRDAALGGKTATRLDAAKNAARETVGRMPCGSQIGLGIFTGHRTLALFTPVEVCAHYDEITAVIADIDWQMAWRARSEIAKGLHSGLRLATGLAQPARLVLFTDGHEAPPIHPRYPPRYDDDLPTRGGLIVGVGGPLPRPIPRFNGAGQLSGTWSAEQVMQVDPYSLGRSSTVAGEAMAGIDRSALQARIDQGTEHLSSLREDYLKRLASGLQFDYRRLTTDGNLESVLTRSSLAYYRRAPLDIRGWLTGLALGLILFAVTIGARSTRAQHPSRPEPMGDPHHLR